MAVPSSGKLALYGDIIGGEKGDAQGNNSLHDMAVYAGFSTPDAMSDFYGWSDVSAPSVSTSAATSVTQSSFTANGNVSNTGGENVSRGFYIGTSTNYASNTKYTIGGTQGTGAFSYNKTGLSPGTTYRFFAWASNSGGETVGAMQTITTFVNFTPSYGGTFQSRVYFDYGSYWVCPSNRNVYKQYEDPNLGYTTYANQNTQAIGGWAVLDSGGNLYNNACTRTYSDMYWGSITPHFNGPYDYQPVSICYQGANITKLYGRLYGNQVFPAQRPGSVGGYFGTTQSSGKGGYWAPAQGGREANSYLGHSHQAGSPTFFDQVWRTHSWMGAQNV